MKKGIAFFDFDGTITNRDTLLEFIRFSKGNFSFCFGFALAMPFIIAYKLKLISNQIAKERVLRFFFAGTKLSEFQKLCDEFAVEKLPSMIRPAALKEIQSHQSKGNIVVVVSASPENWLNKWAQDNGMDLISSKLEVKNGVITGKINGKNCHSEEKVRLIKNRFNLNEFDTIHAYGDSRGDRPMLQLATFAYYKPFRKID